MIDGAPIRQRWEAVGAHLDERGRRLFAAVEVRTAGRGGLAVVSKITGLARSTRAGPGCLNRISASISGASAGLGCQAEGQRGEVGLIGCRAVKARMWAPAVAQQRLGTPTGPFSENCFIDGIRGSGCRWLSTRRSTRRMALSSAAR